MDPINLRIPRGTRVFTGDMTFSRGKYDMAENNKVKKGFWISEDLDEKIDIHLRQDNCSSRSEFVEKALRFYTGYLNARNAGAFLPEVLSTVLIGTMDNFGQRIGTQLHKMAIEQNMCNHILAADTDMDERDYQLLRGRSVREVQSTNGRISFKNVLDFQKSV